MKLFNEQLSNRCRALNRDATDMMQKRVLKGTRWLLHVMITSGPMEGTNNKIKTMKRQAYGFRDKEFFKLKILAIHETTYELVG